MRKSQRGYTGITFVMLVCVCILSGYLFGLLQCYIPADKQILPISLSTIMVGPIAIIAQAISKYGDLKKVRGLTRDEQRRLDPIINTKRRRLYFLLLFFLIATAGIAVLFYVATLSVPFNASLAALRITGTLMAAAIISGFRTYLDLSKIQDYEATITRRLEERKTKAALLKKLSPGSSKEPNR
jgi:hypothetical protein